MIKLKILTAAAIFAIVLLPAAFGGFLWLPTQPAMIASK
jgi:hypothetical protein